MEVVAKMRQAITTHFVGPTNTRGSRYIATSASGHRLVHYANYALGLSENHQAAAMKLADKLGWIGAWFGGATKDGYCFVMPDGDGFAVVPHPKIKTGKCPVCNHHGDDCTGRAADVA